MDYKVIRSEEEFVREKDTWNLLCSKMMNATPFQTWEWNYYWWKNNDSGNSLFVIKAFENQMVYGYAPLVISNSFVEFIGGTNIDYGMFIIYRKEMTVIDGFLQTLKKHNLNIHFQEMAMRDTQAHIIEKLLENEKRVIKRKTTRCSYIQLESYHDYDDYASSLSHSLRAKTIKAAQKAGVSVVQEEVTEKAFQKIADIYANRQEVRGGAPDITWSFAVIKALYENGLADLYIARCQEHDVGFMVVLKYQDTLYAWLVAFKNEYQRAFPGQMLFYQMIRNGFDLKKKCVDFMRGDYDFKLRWQCSIDTNYSFYVYNHGTLRYIKHRIWLFFRSVARNVIYSSRWLTTIYRKIRRKVDNR